MHLIPRNRRIGGVLLLAALPLLFSCQSRLDPIDHRTDAAEFESVWQYLKAWSIYQDSSAYAGRIPTNPFAFRTPEDVLLAVGDRLKGYDYTDYIAQRDAADTIYDFTHASYAPSASVTGTASGDSIILFYALTGSTALLRIRTFEGPEDGQIYNDFLALVPTLQHYRNIIVDLRSNGGGYIDEAQNILTAMVPAGTNYILARQRDYDTLHDRYVTKNWHYWTTTGPQLLTGKHYAVLSNGYTASASELLLAGLYEGQKKEWGANDSMPLLGSRSYGKGIGQVIILRRNAYTGSWSEVDTFSDGAGGKIVIPLTITNYLMLRITFLQIQGVSPRIGWYHEVGIPADAVMPTVQAPVDAAMQRWVANDTTRAILTPIAYAAKTLEPSADLDSLCPSLAAVAGRRGTLPLAKRGASPSAVAERVIITDRIFPMK